MQPERPCLSIESLPGQSPNLSRPHPGAIKPIAEILYIGVAKLQKNSLEIGSLKEALSRVVFWKTREDRHRGERRGLDSQGKGSSQSFELTVDGGRLRPFLLPTAM